VFKGSGGKSYISDGKARGGLQKNGSDNIAEEKRVGA